MTDGQKVVLGVIGIGALFLGVYVLTRSKEQSPVKSQWRAIYTDTPPLNQPDSYQRLEPPTPDETHLSQEMITYDNLEEIELVDIDPELLMPRKIIIHRHSKELR